MGWLDDLLIGPLRAILNAGVEMTSRRAVNFKSGFTLTDNPGDDSIDVEVNTPTASGTVPNAVGAAGSIGVASTFARADHVHAHGSQLIGDGTGHAVATTSLAGFMSATDKTRFDALTPSSATPSNTGTAAAGAAVTYSRSDHVHAHGALAGGTLHATASSDDEGFMPRAHYSLVANAAVAASANTLAKRDSDGTCSFSGVLDCSLVEGVDATVANNPGGNVSWRSGAPLAADIGERNRGHYVTYHGLPASANSYQSGMIVLKCGESDNATNRPEGVWDAMDNGFVGYSGYDTDAGGVERTPYYYRIQAGKNPTTNKGIGIRVDAPFAWVVNSGLTYVSREVTGVGGYFMENSSKNSPSGASTGDGTGVLHYRFHRRITTSGAETKRLATLSAYTINNVFAYNQAVLIAHMAGDTREIYRFDFDWLGGAGVINGPTSMSSGISKSALAGRVALSNSGNELRIDVTGLSTKDLIWTLILDQYQEIL